MKIAVPMKIVPDLVEELELDKSGTRLDYEALKMKVNEFDDHAVEEALLIKQAGGAEVIALAIDSEEADKALFGAIAKGADRGMKIAGIGPEADSADLARAFAEAIKGLGVDLVLTGVQSAADRDGQLAPYLAASLGWPAVSVVTSVEPKDKTVLLRKEYAGGNMAEFELDLPAVLGIQAARQAPRYAPVSKLRQVQQSTKLETFTASGGAKALSKVIKMEPPAKGKGAKMLAKASEIVAILKEKGVL